MSGPGVQIPVVIDPQGDAVRAAHLIVAEIANMKTKSSEAAASTMTLRQGLASFGLVTQGLNAVVGGLERIGRAVGDAERHNTALRNLGGAYDRVSEATNGAITADQAYRTQQSFVQAGINITADQLAAVTRRAREYALATGTDATQALDQLTEALRNGEAGGLRRYGVAVAEGANRTQVFTETTHRFIEAQRGVPVAANTSAESIARARTFIDGMTASFIEGISTSARWVAAVTHLSSALSSLGGASGTHGAGEEESIRAAGRQSNDATLIASGLTQEQLGLLSSGDRVRVGFNLRRGVTLRAALEGLPGLRAQDEENLARRRESALQATALDNAFAIGAQERARASMHSGGGGSASNPLREAIGAANEIRQNAAAAGVDVDSLIERHPGESVHHWAARLHVLGPAIQHDIQDEASQRQAAQAIAERNAEAAQRTRERAANDNAQLGEARERQRSATALGGRVDALSSEGRSILDQQIRGGGSLTDQAVRDVERLTNTGQQFRSAFGDVLFSTQSQAQLAATTVRGAFNSMTGAFRSHLGALISGRETVGEALRGIAHETLLNLATESAVQALFQTAQGFAALATYRYPEAAQHFTSAAIYGGVALLAGGGAALTAPTSSPAAGGGASGGGLAPRSQGVTGGSGSAGGSSSTVISVNFNGAPFQTREDVHDTIVRGVNLARNRSGATDFEIMERRRAAA